jgi:hypothetical protein
VSAEAIEAGGIARLTRDDLVHARELGGAIKPIVSAAWSDDTVETFAGPVFVPLADPLAALDGTTNGIRLVDRSGSVLFFTGPGAGPAVTAVTVLDDVVEAFRGGLVLPTIRRKAQVRAPDTRWILRATSSDRFLSGAVIADLLSACDVRAERSSTGNVDGGNATWLLTSSCSRERINAAAATLAAAANCRTFTVRALA